MIRFNPSEVEAEPIAEFRKYEIVENTVLETSKYRKNEYSGRIYQTSEKTSGLRTEGFVNLIVDAYCNHYKITIRPEDIWLCIQTQFNFYVNKYPEELRNKFVNHEGKIVLEVEEDDISSSIGYLSQKMTKLIKEYLSDPKLIDWILPNFTTTTEKDREVFSMISMATLKNYFKYKFLTRCGLPEIVLLGTPEDWREIKNRCSVLLNFELETKNYMQQWHDMLLPILDKIIETAEGNPDLNWWNRACHYHSGKSGPRYISGWISVFSIFNDDGRWLGDKRNDKVLKIEDSPWPIINTDYIASSYINVGVELKFITKADYNATIYAGIYGADILEDNFMIVPRMNWAICFDISEEEVEKKRIKKELLAKSNKYYRNKLLMSKIKSENESGSKNEK